MSIDRKTSLNNPLIDLLKIPSNSRSSSDLDSILRLTSNLKFFQELTEREESSKLHQECCKLLTVESFHEKEYICRKGEEGTSFYFILKGSVSILSDELFESQEEDNSNPMSSLDPAPDKILAEEAAKTNHLIVEKEIATLAVGQSFGEMALINNRPRYFSVRCLEPTVLGVLLKQHYQVIAKVHFKQINEKVEFIRSMDAFRTWSRIAIQKLSYFFKTSLYKKGGIVYREGDPARDVYIVKEGEFIFTQRFLVDAGQKHGGDSFGTLSRRRAERVMRVKKLNVVIKSKGEIFGYSELKESLANRQFTCICNSTCGELLVISDKNFAKKVVHTETLRFIEDRSEKLKPWIKNRVEELRNTERYKDSVSFTSLNRIKVHRSGRQSFDIKFNSNFEHFRIKNSPPNPIERFINRSQRGSSMKRRFKFNETDSMLFPTELSDNSLARKRKIRLNSFEITKTLAKSLLN